MTVMHLGLTQGPFSRAVPPDRDGPGEDAPPASRVPSLRIKPSWLLERFDTKALGRSPAVRAGGPMTDVTELIVSDHDRICRLFTTLDDVARYVTAGESRGSAPGWVLATTWARIAGLLDMHADAEQEICFLAMFGYRRNQFSEMEDAIADLNDVREAVAETHLQEAGCPAWWRAVDAARRSIHRHIFTIEQGILSDFCARSDGRLRAGLSKQWTAFIAARRHDAVL